MIMTHVCLEEWSYFSMTDVWDKVVIEVRFKRDSRDDISQLSQKRQGKIIQWREKNNFFSIDSKEK